VPLTSIDTTIIMEQVFLLRIEDEAMLEELVKWYSRSTSSAHIRNEVVKVLGVREKDGGVPLNRPGELSSALFEIVKTCPRDVEL
jgi:hypothetical protein